jgi:hypothetical protein
VKQFKLLLLALFFFATSYAQLDPSLTLYNCNVLGVHQLDQSLLILSSGSAKQKLNCTLVDKKGELRWENEVPIPKLSGYNFNKLQVYSGSKSVYLIHQLKKEILLNRLNAQDGTLELEQERIPLDSEDGELKKWMVRNDSLFLISGDNEGLWIKPYLDEDWGEDKLLYPLPEKYRDGFFSPQFTQGSTIFCSGYKLERNHGKMHLFLLKYNTQTHRFHAEEQELKLDYTSFTYHSTFDKRVLGVLPQQKGFYLFGKLDLGFSKAYPTTKMGDNFIGFWVARYNYDLTLDYFTEIPFQYFEGLIPNNVIQKPAVIDLKEDLDHGLHVNINELQGAIYGNKYFVYIDSSGMHQSIEGGKDEFNVLSYDTKGLRSAGRAHKVRLMNDDWPVYASNGFLYITHKPELHSFATENMLNLAQNPKSGLRKEKNYTFLPFTDRVVYLAYQEKKRGTLLVYSQEY